MHIGNMHHYSINVAKLHLNLQYLFYKLGYLRPIKNWLQKKDYTFGQFLSAILFNPQVVEHYV